MNNTPINTSDIISFLLHAQPYIKNRCIGYVNQFNSLKNNQELFKEEILEQFISIIRGIILDEVSKNLACDASLIGLVLDDLNIVEYINS